jgi:hypothetical protein
LVIREKKQESADVIHVFLEADDRHPLGPFLPGQHLTLLLPKMGEGRLLRRCYTLSSGPWDVSRYRLSIKLQQKADGSVGEVSAKIHRELQPGDTLMALAPSGQFVCPVVHPEPVIMVATGIGITPFMSMLHAFARSEAPPRQLWLFWGLRTETDLLFTEEWPVLTAALPQLRLIGAFSQRVPEKTPSWLDVWSGRLEVTRILEALPQRQGDFFLCGSEAMMEAMSRCLSAEGVPRERIFDERFGSNTFHGEGEGRVAVDLWLKRANQQVRCEPHHATLLDALESHGVAIEVGCRTGNCGACRCTALAGAFQHLRRPGLPLLPHQLLPCIARATEPLTLDL